jgi:hypothetical protein
MPTLQRRLLVVHVVVFQRLTRSSCALALDSFVWCMNHIDVSTGALYMWYEEGTTHTANWRERIIVRG